MDIQRPPLRITIVTPSFNQGAFLEHAIDSVVSQKYPNLEYIVVDGASSDNSLDVLDRHSESISYFISEPDRGHWDALRKGFSVSTGEVMGWINSDDMLTPWSLACISQIFTLFPHVNWIQGLPSTWNSMGYMTNVGGPMKNIYDFINGDYQWIQQESVFWRRSLWESAGARISDKYSFMIDGELWSRFFLQDKLYSVGCILGGYRNHGHNRALKYAENCRKEMNSIITDLRFQSPVDVLNVASVLSRAKRICRLPLFEATRTSKHLWWLLAMSVIKESAGIASYPVINWDYNANAWSESIAPYSF